MRKFETGATRDSDDTKLDYEGFLNPFVLTRFSEYMHSHRKQADGNLRASDNWQKGIPTDVYMKSFIRHSMELWRLHRNDTWEGCPHEDMEEAICAILFNAQGLLLNLLRARSYAPEYKQEPTDTPVRGDCGPNTPGVCPEDIHESNGYSRDNIESVPVWISGVPLRDKRVSSEEQEADGLSDCEVCGCRIPPAASLPKTFGHSSWKDTCKV